MGETAAVWRQYGRGEVIYGEGQACDGLYVLNRGLVKLARPYRSGGKEAILRLAGPWDVLGHPAFGADTVRQARAEAITACEVVKVPRVFVERALKRHPEAALILTALLGLELGRREEWAGCLVPYRAEAKLAGLLPLLAGRFGRRTDAGTVVLPRLTHDELAQMIATTRESVTNALGDLRRRGVLGYEKGRIVVLEPGLLAEVARLRHAQVPETALRAGFGGRH
jgi:CRP/FNR family transcriptional regulator